MSESLSLLRALVLGRPPVFLGPGQTLLPEPMPTVVFLFIIMPLVAFDLMVISTEHIK